MDVGADNFRFTLDDPEKKSKAFRYPQSAELHVSSLDRFNSTPTVTQTLMQLSADLSEPLGSYNYSATDCVIQAPGRAMLYGYFNRIAITEMQLFLRVPTVITGVNDQFVLSASLTGVSPYVSQTFTVPPGYYTPSLLAVALQTLIRANATNLTDASVFTVTAPTTPANIPASGAIQTGFNFSSGNTDTLVFAPPPGGSTRATQLRIWKFYRLIGSNYLSFVGTPGFIPTATIATFSPNFLPTDYIDVVSKALTNYKDVKDSNSNEQAPQGVLARIYLTDNAVNAASTTNSYSDPNAVGGAPFSFTKKWSNPNWSLWSPNEAVNQLDFKLLDMWGEPIYWTNTKACANTEWQITLVASE
jgi:hypothetical protein